MILNFDHWLIATASFATFGAAGALIAFQFRRRKLGFILTLVGLAGGFVSSAIVAALLVQPSESQPIVASSPNWIWFSFSGRRALSLEFGLQATWIKASLIGLTGLIAFIAVLIGHVRKRNPIADAAVLATSLLYAVGVVFVFAPNFVQALLGWAAVSLIASILIRLARPVTPVDQIEVQGRTHSITEPHSKRLVDEQEFQGLQVVTAGLTRLEHFVADRLIRAATTWLPTSIVEQLELVEGTSTSFQLSATVVCAAAILLTWLILNV